MCAGQPSGAVPFCEDEVPTFTAEPQGPPTWVLARHPNVNNNLPYWASWSVLAAAENPVPAPEPPAPPVPPTGSPMDWENPPPHQTVK